jgi:hypothetical protein
VIWLLSLRNAPWCARPEKRFHRPAARSHVSSAAAPLAQAEQGRSFTEQEKAVFRKRGEHRFKIPDGSRWGDVKAASINIGEVLTKAMRAVADANEELRGVFTVDWNQPAPDGSGKLRWTPKMRQLAKVEPCP